MEEKLLTLPLQTKIRENLKDQNFLKQLITEFVKAYAANPAHADVQLLLPNGSQKDLKEFVVKLMGQHYGKAGTDKLALSMESEGVRFGFQADQKDGNVRFDFSDDAFLMLFLRFMAPGFRELFADISTVKKLAGEMAQK